MDTLNGSAISLTHLKVWRLRRKLGQKEAARLLGFGISAYGLIESGRMRPSESQMAALRRMFGDRAAQMVQPPCRNAGAGFARASSSEGRLLSGAPARLPSSSVSS
jgi:transcriptional regulator with XRE-family HTH domain